MIIKTATNNAKTSFVDCALGRQLYHSHSTTHKALSQSGLLLLELAWIINPIANPHSYRSEKNIRQHVMGGYGKPFESF